MVLPWRAKYVKCTQTGGREQSTEIKSIEPAGHVHSYSTINELELLSLRQDVGNFSESPETGRSGRRGGSVIGESDPKQASSDGSALSVC